jgi:hypothetical protein
MATEHVHWKQYINLDYIGAYSLDGKDRTVKIISVCREEVTGDRGKKEMCIVAHLENEKPFIINRTNAKMITKLTGTPYIDKWVGARITLYPTTTSVGGETVECLRIRPTLPAEVKKVEIKPGHPKWQAAVDFVAKGGQVAKLLESYIISHEDQAKLTANVS